MPYINLNSSKINYQYSIGNDLFIVSGIVDSPCSYKSPKVIRSRKELDIYFGRSFKERGYFEELLDSGVSLLLYKPISTSIKESWKTPEKEEIYLCLSEFPKSGSEDVLYIDSYSQEKYIWNSDTSDYININDLPQNIYSLDNYESWYNRDTLRICSTEKINVDKKEAELLAKKFKENPIITPDSTSSVDTIIISNKSKEEGSKIYFQHPDQTQLEKFYLRTGLNFLKKDSIVDLYSELNAEVEIIFVDGKETLKTVWYRMVSLQKTITALVPETRNLVVDNISKIVINRLYSDYEIQNPLLSCYPRYKTEFPIELKNNSGLIRHFGLNPKYFKETLENNRTLAFTLDFSQVSSFEGKDSLSGYICFPIPNEKDSKSLIWFNDGTKKEPLSGDIVMAEYRHEVPYDPQNLDKERLISDVLSIFERYGYFYEKIENNYIYTVYSELSSIPNLGFTNIGGLGFSSNLTITQDILSQVSENYARLEFYSKTIGPNDESIKVKIEEIPYPG